MTMPPKEDTFAIAREIAARLGEEDTGPIRQIEMLIRYVGLELVQQKTEEAIQLDAGDGMLTQTGDRRRTLGGIFFYIIKRDMDPSIRQRVFPNFGMQRKGAVLEWADRMSHIAPLLESTPGEGDQIKITVTGRPGEVLIYDNTVMITIASAPREDAPIPRGVPLPPAEATPFIIYMALKHWEPVKRALDKHTSDQIMVEGLCALDRDAGAIAIFATAVTTTKLQKAEKSQQKQAAIKAAAKAAKAEAKAQGKKGGAQPVANAQPGQPKKPKPAPAPAAPAVEIPVPAGMPTDAVEKLRQLHNAAITLRERIAAKESAGQKAPLEQKLLQNTEKQIAELENQYK
jgi:hypothetical protein